MFDRYFRAERQERYGSDLKELLAERNADDSYAEDSAYEKSSKSAFPSDQKDPQDVRERLNKTRIVNDFLPEWTSAEGSQLKAFMSEGYTDDRYIEDNAGENHAQPIYKSSKDKPQNVH